MKKFLYIAAISLAAILSLSACEKNPDNGGNGDDTGKPGVAKPVKSITAYGEGEGRIDYFFTTDAKGRILNTKSEYYNETGNLEFQSEGPNIEYGDNFCKITEISEDFQQKEVSEFVMEDGKAVSGTYKVYYQGTERESHEIQYKYDGSGFLTEISINAKNRYFKKSITKLEWENGCLKSWYEEEFDENDEISFKNREIFYYGTDENLISNLNPFQRRYNYGDTEWHFEFIMNLLGKQSKYLPIKQESYAREYLEGGIKPGDPGDDFEEDMEISTFEYEFNKDKTISNVIYTYDAGDSNIISKYKFNY